jgi:hypothetical protein
MRAIIQGLNDAKVRYLVVGPLAVVAHGCMPQTENIELSLVPDAGNTGRMMSCLAGMGYRRHVPMTAVEIAEEARRERMEGEEFAKVLRFRSKRREEIDVCVVLDERLDFEEMYARSESLALAAGVEIPMCAYGDFVRLKRQSGRANDFVDLEQLEKARRERLAYDPWYEATFEGNELWQLWRWADLPLGEKIRSLEESWKVGRIFQETRGH